MSRGTPIRRPIHPDKTPSIAASVGITAVLVGTVVAVLAVASSPGLAAAFVGGVGTAVLIRVGRRTIVTRRNPDGTVGSPERPPS